MTHKNCKGVNTNHTKQNIMKFNTIVFELQKLDYTVWRTKRRLMIYLI